MIDAVSGATAATATSYETSVSLKAGHYFVFLEVNRSYDYDERFTRAHSGVNGQPSLVYRAEIVVGKETSTGRFTAVSVGSVDGSDGSI